MFDEKTSGLILKYIKSGKNVDEILKKDNSWPVYYHLASNRQNILNWYPFKKNATILEVNSELGALTPYLCSVAKKVVSIVSSNNSKNIIAEKTKNYKNIEFEKKLDGIKEKFDYIVMMDTIENLSNCVKLLKPSGKILLAVDNRFGLKYWCGAKDDLTNQVFGSINGNQMYSKKDLESLFEKNKLKYNFYYLFPDHKFPELILTDEILLDNNNHTYNSFYKQPYHMFANEKKLFRDILNNGKVDFFANSFFIELSVKVIKKEVEYVKYNNYRNDKYALVTYKKNNKYYKKAIKKDGIEHIKNIVKYAEILKEYNINLIPVYLENDECYTEKCNNYHLLIDKIIALFKVGKIDEVYKEINKYVDFLYNHFNTIDISDKTTVFDKYNIKITDKQKSKLHFVKDGFIDLCFQNIIVDNSEYLLIDQEWYEKNVPLEYIIYRSVHLLVYNYNLFENSDEANEMFNYIIKMVNIDRIYIKMFEEINDNFMLSVVNKIGIRSTYELYKSYGLVPIININEILDNYNNYFDNLLLLNNQNNQIHMLNNMIKIQENELKMIKKDNYNKDIIIDELNKKNNDLSIKLSRIYNSKGYKLLLKFYKIKNRRK